ncbi:MAG: DEAD/DEAH box helicase, partial [Cyanobium sp.]
MASLERRQLVLREQGPAPGGATLPEDPPCGPPPPRTLTAAQGQALAAIEAAAAGSPLLLWGVTGAGKTEVYLQAAARCLASGRSALLLAPEIGLIPQLLDRCQERFGAGVVEFHSGMA